MRTKTVKITCPKCSNTVELVDPTRNSGVWRCRCGQLFVNEGKRAELPKAHVLPKP